MITRRTNFDCPSSCASRRTMFGIASFKTEYIRYSSSGCIILLLPVFILDELRDAVITRRTNFDCPSSCASRRTMFGSASFKTEYIRYSSSRRTIRLVPVFILDELRDAQPEKLRLFA